MEFAHDPLSANPCVNFMQTPNRAGEGFYFLRGLGRAVSGGRKQSISPCRPWTLIYFSISASISKFLYFRNESALCVSAVQFLS